MLATCAPVVIELDDGQEQLAVEPRRYSTGQRPPRPQKPAAVEEIGWSPIALEAGQKIPDAISKLVYSVVRHMHRQLFAEWGSARLALELGASKVEGLSIFDWLIPLRIIDVQHQDITVVNKAKYKLVFDVVNPLYLSPASRDTLLDSFGKERVEKLFSEWYSLTAGASARKLEQLTIDQKARMLTAMFQAVDPAKYAALIESGSVPGEKVERWECVVVVNTGTGPMDIRSFDVISNVFVDDFDIATVMSTKEN